MVINIKKLAAELVKLMDISPIFKDIEEQRKKTDAELLEILKHLIPDIKNRGNLLDAIIRACRIYQTQGYFKGINQRVQLDNSLSGNHIQIHDITTGKQII